MLKKLIKYDFKNISKILVVFYVITIFFAILARLFNSFDNSFILSIIGKICNITTISMLFNIIVNNVIRLWVNFKKNFYEDESYLTHTLPVSKKELYLSKIIASIISLFMSFIVICISLFIAFYSKENIELVKQMLLPMASMYESTIVVIIIEFIFICFLEIMNILQVGYSGIILGHKNNSNKMLNTFLSGVVVYLVTQIFIVISIFIVALFNKDLMNLFNTIDALNVDIIKFCIVLAFIFYSLSIIILYFVNAKLFSKGVNVD